MLWHRRAVESLAESGNVHPSQTFSRTKLISSPNGRVTASPPYMGRYTDVCNRSTLLYRIENEAPASLVFCLMHMVSAVAFLSGAMAMCRCGHASEL